MDDTQIVMCKNGHRLRVPTTARTLSVTCPLCREKFDWPSPQPCDDNLTAPDGTTTDCKIPSLFGFATSELSQDAFIGWLASWADPSHRAADESLHGTARLLLDRLLEACGVSRPSEYQSVKVRRQHKKIDVLVVVNDDTAILIEDKTNTADHSDQLRRYKVSER